MKKFLSLFLAVIFSFSLLVGCGGNRSEDNLPPDDSQTENKNPPSKEDKPDTPPTDNEASYLARRAVDTILRYMNDSESAVKTELGRRILTDSKKTVVDGDFTYICTDIEYSKAADKYSRIFTGEALDAFLKKNFKEVDGTLYVISSKDGISKVSNDVFWVYFENESDGKYNYTVIYDSFFEYDPDIDKLNSVRLTYDFTLEKADSGYKISYIGLLDDSTNIASHIVKKAVDSILLYMKDSEAAVKTELGLKIPADGKATVTDGDKVYLPTDSDYSKAEEKYSEIFTGEALDAFLKKNFKDIDGTLYVVSSKDGKSRAREFFEVRFENESDGKYNYTISYDLLYKSYPDSGAAFVEETYNFSLEKAEGGYRISYLGLLDDSLIKEDLSGSYTETDKEALSLVEKAASRIYAYLNDSESAESRDFEGITVYYSEEQSDPGYRRTDRKYSEAAAKYSEIFTGEALDTFLNRNFKDVDGTLYVTSWMGGWAIGIMDGSFSLKLESEADGKYNYSADYYLYQGLNSETYDEFFIRAKASFTVERTDGGLRISELSILDIYKDE